MGIAKYRNIISESDMVLIGIGEEFRIPDSEIEETIIYKTYIEKLKCEREPDEFEWIKEQIHAYCYMSFLDNLESNLITAYRNLCDMVKDKNYFIVTLNTDNILETIGFDKSRMVSPCGTFRQMQCSNQCSNLLWDSKEEVIQNIRMLLDKTKGLNELSRPRCPVCGKEANFNLKSNVNYLEEGYLEQWRKYTDWLSCTLNQKICILELGVDFKYPSVIRWPFEKVAYFNQKASFIRSSAKFPQLTQELENRREMYSEAGDAIDFLL